MFDEDLDMVLGAVQAGSAERKMDSLTAITYNLAKERFGAVPRKEMKARQENQENRRERKIKQLRKEIKALRKQFKQASTEENEGIKELTASHREQLIRARRAERLRLLRQRRKKREAARAQFIKDPYRFTKALLGEARSGTLASSKEEVEEFVEETFSDSSRNVTLAEDHRLGTTNPPTASLSTDSPSWREVQEVVKHARSSSAPGPSGIPYKVYKKCPGLLRRVWKLMRVIWSKGVVPTSWRRAEGCFVPKERGSSQISQFRTISFLSVEGKIFFSVLARRMSTYMTQNGYIDTSIQKGAIEGFSGCLEHTGVISQLIQEAKEKKGNLTVVWLDFANAYGSIPHNLIQVAMDHYHIPRHIQGMITKYLGDIKLRFQSAMFTTKWQPVEKGIVTGCTISPILFAMGMNLIITAASIKSRGPKTAAGSQQPVIRAFMDDLTVITPTHVQARWVLVELDRMATWAKMIFKPKKSRCLRFKLCVQGEEIPNIQGNPIKCLGKWYDDSLSDKNSISSSEKQVDEWLNKIDKSGLPGKYKCWIYQHGLLQRLMWLLTIYEVPITSVEGLERKFNKHLRRWLGIPPSFTSVGLYISADFPSHIGIQKTNSQGKQEYGQSGRKWAASTAIDQAEASLRTKDIIGNPCTGRQGLGTSHFQQWSKSTPREKRTLVQEEVRSLEEEGRRAKSIELGTQGAWTRWNLPKRAITWSEMWRLEPFRISFMLRAVYDTLPTPVNLHRWGMREDPRCKLCGGKGTMAHILSGCKTALTQGRYRWRHDKVLAQLAEILEQERRKKRPAKTKPLLSTITFIREGQRPGVQGQAKQNLLQSAQEWELEVDLGRKLHFPEAVLSTTLRPDIVMWSLEGKKIILVELTVPWEENCEGAAERKKEKYQQLVLDCRDKGWTTWLMAVEVGCQGFPAQSAWNLLTKMGLRGHLRKTAVRRLGEAAERASCWLWHKREDLSWKPGGGGQ
ncbi:Retrovirus-related Pol polyprotein from type-1 retrotransposable element R2 [Merluccius polli]|uniref:Retrovirus-related Pol polyprotein from type-1 retrotransposable element R2 n=1 Tax=Merluccius polli TaxID=89951 RepID=A0AA47M8G5_MERPO|nr:Retrovirus-related Pol polyprotein from type-1 retrotransposable element R2 [Merluccius polli]